MDDPYGSRLDAILGVLRAYERDLERLDATWRALETKAQGTVTVAGVFVGFCLTFAKELPSTAPPLIRGFLTLTIVLLVLAALAAWLALMVQGFKVGASGTDIEGFSNDLYTTIAPRDRPEYRPLFLQSQIGLLKDAIGDRTSKNQTKAGRIQTAQVFLGSAIACAAVLAGILVWSKHPPQSTEGAPSCPDVQPAGAATRPCKVPTAAPTVPAPAPCTGPKK